MYEGQIKVDWEINYAEKTEGELRKLIEEAYRDDLLNRFLYDDKWEQGYQDGMIDGYKKRDAEIIRCKDCKNWQIELGGHYCDIIDSTTEQSFFCAYGERREITE